MKIEKTGDSSPLGTLQGPSKGPQIAKTAENPKNHDFFLLFFFPLRQKKMSAVRIPSNGLGEQEKRLGPLGAPSWGPYRLKKAKLIKMVLISIVKKDKYLSILSMQSCESNFIHCLIE